MDCAIVFLTLIFATLGSPLLEVPADLAGPGNGEYGIDVIGIGRDSEVSTSNAYGLRHRGGYHFNQRFELEGLVGGAIDNEGLCSSTILLAGVIDFHPHEQIAPYLAFGLGQANRDLETPTEDLNDSGFAYHMMAGTKFFFTRAHVAALRVEGGLLVEDTFDSGTTHATFAIGVTWRLGGR